LSVAPTFRSARAGLKASATSRQVPDESGRYEPNLDTTQYAKSDCGESERAKITRVCRLAPLGGGWSSIVARSVGGVKSAGGATSHKLT
jgi:hypothetical protein